MSISTAMHALVGARPRRPRDHAGRDLGRHARGRPGRAPALGAPRPPRPHRHAGAPDGAAAEAHVVPRARAGDVRGGRAAGAGSRSSSSQRLTGTWAIDHSCASGTGLHGTARPRLGRRGARAGGGRRRAARAARARDRAPRADPRGGRGDAGSPPGCRSSPAAATGRSRTSASARSAPASRRARSGRAARCGSSSSAPWSTRAGGSSATRSTPGRWVVGGAINNGGVVLQWAGRRARARTSATTRRRSCSTLAAEAPAGSAGLIMLPYLLSERAPHWSPLPRGAYVGLTRAHRPRAPRPRRARGRLPAARARARLDARRGQRGPRDPRDRRLRAERPLAPDPRGRPRHADRLPRRPRGLRVRRGAASGWRRSASWRASGVAADLVRIADVVEPDEDEAATYARAPADVRRPVRRARAGVPRAADARRSRGAGRPRRRGVELSAGFALLSVGASSAWR